MVKKWKSLRLTILPKSQRKTKKRVVHSQAMKNLKNCLIKTPKPTNAVSQTLNWHKRGLLRIKVGRRQVMKPKKSVELALRNVTKNKRIRNKM
jgi:hypothetical protein